MSYNDRDRDRDWDRERDRDRGRGRGRDVRGRDRDRRDERNGLARDPDLMEDDTTPLCQGFLSKKNHSGRPGMRFWRRRWFVLTPSLLCYWPNKDEYEKRPRKPSGVFHRCHIHDLAVKETRGPNRFEFMYAEEHRDMLVELEADEDKPHDVELWMRNLAKEVASYALADTLATSLPQLQKENTALRKENTRWQVKIMEAQRQLQEEKDKRAQLNPKLGEADLKSTMMQRKIDTLEDVVETHIATIDRLKAEIRGLQAEHAACPARILRANGEVKRLEREKEVRDIIQEEAKQAFARLSPLLGCEFATADEGRGTLITMVTEGLPADISGLQAGDIVLTVAHAQVTDKQDFSHAISGFNPGDSMPVNIKRGRTRTTIMVELGSPGMTRREIRDLRRRAAGGVTQDDIDVYMLEN